MKRWVGVVALIVGACVGEEDAAQVQLAVVGGAADPGELGETLIPEHQRAVVALARSVDGMPFCSGSLIGERLVLTAAHCVLDNEDAWLEGAAPVAIPPSFYPQMRIVVGADTRSPECTFEVADIVVNPEAHIRDRERESDHANPHDTAVVVLAASASTACPGVWPLRARLETLTSELVGRTVMQGGYGATSDDPEGPQNFGRWWSRFDVAEVATFDVALDGRGQGRLNFGDSGSPILATREDGGVEVVAVTSNFDRHARTDVDRAWITSMFAGGALCGELPVDGECDGAMAVSCDPAVGVEHVACELPDEEGGCTVAVGGGRARVSSALWLALALLVSPAWRRLRRRSRRGPLGQPPR